MKIPPSGPGASNRFLPLLPPRAPAIRSIPGPRRRSGVALIMTLGMIVLVTIMIMAFYSYATATAKIENSRAEQVKTEQLAQSALSYVSHQFLQEIQTTSTTFTNNGIVIFQPTSGINLSPLRLMSPGVLPTDARFFNLTRQSVSTADANASADNTATPSQNGRVLGATRWNFPVLAAGGGFSGANQLPNWIYIGKTTGITNAASPTAIGRFAYNAYNIGNLLDLNVAGYPTGTTAAQIKSTVAGADLTQLGISQAAIDSLVTRFRNAGVNNYSNQVSTFSRNGFLSAIATNSVGKIMTNNYFLNRQDLLRYAQTQNTGLTNSLPYLTAFSRSVNAPSWGPTTTTVTYPYQSKANTSGSTNRFLPNVRFTSSSTIPHYQDNGTSVSYAVQIDSPLLTHRFSLSKLAWLTHTGPATGIAPGGGAISDKAIQDCFGLHWNATNAGWDYVGDSNPPTMQSAIKTLDQVAAANPQREPNFFELLQAGILSGSLGAAGVPGSTTGGVTNGGSYADAVNKAYQIIRIGANIVDQYDTDSYPTEITFDSVAFWGIEDLPYFDRIFPGAIWPAGVTTQVPPVYNHITCQLWNPHQQAATSASPTQFRIRINTDATYYISYGQFDGNTPVGVTQVYPFGQTPMSLVQNVTPSTLVFSSSASSADTQVSYREPHLIRMTGANDPHTGSVSFMLPTSTIITPKWVNSANAGTNLHVFINRGVFVLEYQDQNGTYRPYTTFTGHEEGNGISGLGGATGLPPAISATVSSIGYGFAKPDPRTFRFDASYQASSEGSLRPVSPASYTSFLYIYPTFMTSPAALARLASNNPANAGQFYKDPDGVARFGDCYSNDQNPFWPNVPIARPILLNRPFLSVAELGYAYRDLPFKTLDLFTSQSPDAGLLDLFSVADTPAVVAGKINLNTPYPQLLQSLLSGASGVANASTLAAAYQSYALNTDGTPKSAAPLTVADLPAFIYSGTSGLGDLKPNREAPVRALADAVQTRTWNLLIDVVAQTGRFPGTGTSGTDFLVEGEKRYWLSIAIDRYTNKIVDEELEVVNE